MARTHTSLQKQPTRRDTVRRLRPVARSETKISLNDEIAHLRGLDVKGLRARWKGMFRREPFLHLPRHLLFAVLAWPTFRRSKMTLAAGGAGVSKGVRDNAVNDDYANAFQQIEAQMAKLGLARAKAEPPRTWLRRLATEARSVITAEQLTAAGAVVDALYRRRYGSAN